MPERMSNDLFFTRDFTYYQVNTLDSRISNIDQLLTQDVEKFCSSVADLYTNISKVRDLIRLFGTDRVDLAFLGHHHLRSETLGIDRTRWSVVVGLLFALFGIRLDEVRESFDRGFHCIWLDFVVPLDG